MKKLFTLFICFLSFSKFVKSQDSFYMEYVMTIGNEKDGMKSTNKTWHSGSGSRIESEMNIPGFGLKKTIMIMPKSNPDVIYTIDEAKKSYTEMIKPAESKENDDYTVEIIGQEKVGNYNCTHARIKTKDQVFEIWITKDIVGYKELYNMAMLQNAAKGLGKALQSNEQLMGVMVKMKSTEKKGAFTMELVKFEKGNFPVTMFEIPAGYTKGASFDPSKMQNMSQEERQKMLEEMMKQYGKDEKE